MKAGFRPAPHFLQIEHGKRDGGGVAWSKGGEMKADSGKPRIDWRGVDLRGANLSGINLEGADLRAADLRGVNFSHSMLRYVDFRGAQMQGCNCQNANLYGAKMQGVDADLADFRGADLRQVNLGGAYLQGAMMPAPAAEAGKEGFAEILAAHAKADGKSESRERTLER
jgi:uncharacterized protein YjbI with pentapeptide repeats